MEKTSQWGIEESASTTKYDIREIGKRRPMWDGQPWRKDNLCIKMVIKEKNVNVTLKMSRQNHKS